MPRNDLCPIPGLSSTFFYPVSRSTGILFWQSRLFLPNKTGGIAVSASTCYSGRVGIVRLRQVCYPLDESKGRAPGKESNPSEETRGRKFICDRKRKRERKTKTRGKSSHRFLNPSLYLKFRETRGPTS